VSKKSALITNELMQGLERLFFMMTSTSVQVTAYFQENVPWYYFWGGAGALPFWPVPHSLNALLAYHFSI